MCVWGCLCRFVHTYMYKIYYVLLYNIYIYIYIGESLLLPTPK